jgi:hypothetical protein
VRVVRFYSTSLNTLSTFLTRGPPAAVAGLKAPAGPTSSQGRPLVLEKSAGLIGPTSVHNRYVSVRYSGIQKNDIYKKT